MSSTTMFIYLILSYWLWSLRFPDLFLGLIGNKYYMSVILHKGAVLSY